ncbi:hypothetical protein COY62_01445 [bacterium (Candidatus Howlettbacteria) CG_4_10_14_0_8_um_filter_40_9]|nr:MAG: hypothetical protein COY62_01445 [bacterium (Candidatus Howlettbacteria) CG_4_10_14_0_8_um_filter_40_9]
MIIYAKFNQARKKEFQLLTTIEKKNGKLFACKKANSKESEKFLLTLVDKYELLSKASLPFEAEKPILVDQAVSFSYLNGESLDSLLFEAVLGKNKEKIKKIFSSYQEMISKIKTENVVLGAEFEKIFGQVNKEKKNCIKPGMLDLLLENIFESKDGLRLIDYEWLFSFPLPSKYICFRTIVNAYYKYSSYNIALLLPLKEVYKIFGISTKEEKEFQGYEHSFLVYVHKKDGVVDLETYIESYKTLGINTRVDFITEAEMEKTRAEKMILLKDQAIAELNDVKTKNEQEIAKLTAANSVIYSSKLWKLRSLVIKIRVKLGLTRRW